jgi:hypothetical protein
MRFVWQLMVVIIGAALALGCPSKSDAERRSEVKADAMPPPAPSVASAAASMAAPSAAPPEAPAVTSVKDPRFAQLPLFSKLAVEKQDRPPTALKAETVFDAVAAKLGAPLKNRSQLAGFTVLAGYCEKGDTELAVDIVVCEYHDAAALTKGKELALKNKTPRREMLTAKSSWVSVTRFTDTPAAAEQAKLISEVVKSLAAAP